MKLNPSDFRKIVIGSFLAVPFLSSLISTIHIITFFGLGNMSWMAIILALAFEIGSIASLMTLTVLDKVNKAAVWFIFFVLVIMQMLGNVYYTYDFISSAMSSNPKWIDSFIDLVEMMTMQKLEQRTTKFILSLLIGLPIPIISLAFLKSVSDYLKPENNTEPINIVESIENEEIEEDIVKEEILVEETESNKEETILENIEYSMKSALESEVNNQITDSVTVSIDNEGNKENQIENIKTITEDSPIKEELEYTDIKEEVIDNKELPEEEINIYEEEPEESYFYDTTIEEQYDNFEENEDDEKKNI
jgi:hypothetical protein